MSKPKVDKEDEKYLAHTGIPFGIDDKINNVDLNKNGVPDIVEVGRVVDKVIPPLVGFVEAGGLDPIEKLIEKDLNPEALKHLQELKAVAKLIAAAQAGK